MTEVGETPASPGVASVSRARRRYDWSSSDPSVSAPPARRLLSRESPSAMRPEHDASSSSDAQARPRRPLTLAMLGEQVLSTYPCGSAASSDLDRVAAEPDLALRDPLARVRPLDHGAFHHAASRHASDGRASRRSRTAPRARLLWRPRLRRLPSLRRGGSARPRSFRLPPGACPNRIIPARPGTYRVLLSQPRPWLYPGTYAGGGVRVIMDR